MLDQCHEMLAHQRASPRWKEWIPLISQQLRLRNLIQVIAYNVNASDKTKYDLKTKGSKSEKIKSSFYFTLHLTTMSAPFYTSEKLENENPKWAEIEIGDFLNAINASVNGIVVRLWVHRSTEQDQVLTVWGVYFSGLAYLGPKLCSDPSAFCLNTIVFHMQGGYFTALQGFKEPPFSCLRRSQVKINSVDVRPSYTVNLVSRLHTIQQAIKKQRCAAHILREKISVGGYTAPESRESATLRRLLNKTRPQAPQRQEVLKLQREIETTKFRVEMLSQERSRKVNELQNLEKVKYSLHEINQNRGIKLLDKYQSLHKEMEQIKERKKTLMDNRDAYLKLNAQLIFRQKQLISKLKEIYPVTEISGGKLAICGVHLPNSEDFANNDEIMTSVSLGYVAHVLQMLSTFLEVPLRYPIIHFGSWSKIIDHISEKIPEKDKEFPLYSRGKDKLQFYYGVYLLNKNVSQLRWYCNLSTLDLRATLPNLSELLNITPEMDSDCLHHHYHQHVSCGSSLDLHSSPQNESPVGSVPVEIKKQIFEKDVTANSFQKDRSVSRSVDNADINFHLKMNEPDVQSAKEFKISSKNSDQLTGSPSVSTNLSYSLDKGLDEYEEMKKAELPCKPASSLKPQVTCGRTLASVGSEPILTQEMRDRIQTQKDLETITSENDAKKHFLQNWQARGPAPVCSDEEVVPLCSRPFHRALSPESPVLQSKNVDRGVIERKSVDNIEHFSRVPAQTLQCTENSVPVQEEVASKNEKLHTTLEGTFPQKINILCCKDNAFNEISFLNNHIPNEENEGSEEKMKIEDSVGTECNSHCDTSKKSECIIESDYSLCPTDKSLQNGTSQMIDREISNRKDIIDETVSLEEINNLIDSSVLVDSMFASVASRTEALANRSGTFNLVRSRHSSILEDGNS